MPTLVASELHITVGTEVGNTTITTGLQSGSVLRITMSLGLLTASLYDADSLHHDGVIEAIQ